MLTASSMNQATPPHQAMPPSRIYMWQFPAWDSLIQSCRVLWVTPTLSLTATRPVVSIHQSTDNAVRNPHSSPHLTDGGWETSRQLPMTSQLVLTMLWTLRQGPSFTALATVTRMITRFIRNHIASTYTKNTRLIRLCHYAFVVFNLC